MIGSRLGPGNAVRSFVARAMAHTLTAYIVPDARAARDAGLDLAEAGVAVAATPRHASVLIVVGELPPGLRASAAIVYAQMPRPRAILALGTDTVAPLPAADVVMAVEQISLEEGLAHIGTLFSSHAWSEASIPFTADILASAVENDAGMDHNAHEHGGHTAHVVPNAEDEGHSIAGSRTPTEEDRTGYVEQTESQDEHAHHHGEEHPEGAAPGRTGHQGEHLHDAMDHREQGGHDRHAGHGQTGTHQDDTTYNANPRPAHASDDVPEALSHGDHTTMVHGNHEVPESAAHQQPTPADSGEPIDHPVGAEHNHENLDHAHHAPMDDDVPVDAHLDYPSGPAQDHHAEMNHDDHAAMSHNSHAGMDQHAPHDAHETVAHGTMGHDMSGHDHHMMDGGFMSMVAMTRDLPRSLDGLPMEWTETAFGPLFPGLPAGLAVKLTLDGDTVAIATIDTGHVRRDVSASLPGQAETLANRLAALDPLAPTAYRVLAMKGLAAVHGREHAEAVDRASIGATERERLASHLGWLAAFLDLLGASSLANHAARLHLATSRAPDVPTIRQLRRHIERLDRDVSRTPMLVRRTDGIGQLESPALRYASGPVARASGQEADVRSDSQAYLSLGFAPVGYDGGDTSSRLYTRLAEIHQSLDLITASDTISLPHVEVPAHLTGSSMATVETPRGAASVHLVVHHGEIQEAHLSTPSRAIMDLVPVVSEQAELADALVAIASLDLSPWEIDQ